MTIKVKAKEATAIINSLIGGVVPKSGIQHITVGRTDEVATIVKALEDVKNGHSMMKFWIGDFGSGKSFMLHLLNMVALKQKFVVAGADFTPHTRLYSNDGKSVALYSALMDNIAIQTKPEGGALPVLLEKWIEQAIMQTAETHHIPLTGIRNPQHFNLIQNTIMKTVNEITDVGGFDFGLAVVKYYEGFVTDNDVLKKNALKWMKGEYVTKTEARNDLGVGEIINDRNYYEMLRNFCRLFVSIGYSGLVVNLDEGINLYKIVHPGMRQKNYEKLLSIYNDCFQGRVSHLFFNIAGTTDVLENPQRGFYSYEALKTRLKTNKFETLELRDFAQPVIRLMPLSHNEIFVLLQKLKMIFELNYQVEINFSHQDIHTFMEEMFNKPGASDFLTPREVIRDFLNILNIIRQNPGVQKEKLFREIIIVDERPDTRITEEDVKKDKLQKLEKQCKSMRLSSDITAELSGMLLDDENLLKAIPGSFENNAGTLLATDKRLIFINKECTSTSFPYSQINEMSYTKGQPYSILHIHLNNDKFNIDLIPTSQIKPLITLLEAQIDILERKTLAAELQYWQKEITNEGVRKNLERMGRIAYIIQEKDHVAGEAFFMRHTATVTKMLKQYHALETSGIDTQDMSDSMARIADTITLTRQAFEQELNNIFKSDLLDVDAESEAYLQSLRNRGLIDPEKD